MQSTAMPHKLILSLLIAVVLGTGITVLAFTGLFDLVETRFYNPSITKSLIRETVRDMEEIQHLLSDLHDRFAGSLHEPPVRRSFLPEQRFDDIFERSKTYGILMESIGGFQSVRFVDVAGRRIHFSTYTPDIIRQDDRSIEYRNYTDDGSNLPFESVQVPEGGGSRIILDARRDRIIFSFPFFDSMDVYRGTAIFTVSERAATERLISTGRIKAGDNLTIISAPPGIISGSPETANNAILNAVSSVWNSGLADLVPFDSGVSGISLALVSAKTSQGIFYGRLINDALFAFSPALKTLLLLSSFLTIFLTVFFCLNIRQDPVIVIQSRLHKLQLSLIQQFYEQKGEMDWARWTMELEQRRKGVRAEIKRGINFRRGNYSEPEIDSLIDKSWDELLALAGERHTGSAAADVEKLQALLHRILQSLPAAPPPGVMPPAVAARRAVPTDSVPTGKEQTPIAKKHHNARRHTTSGARGPKQEVSKSCGLLAAASQKRAVIHPAAGGGNPLLILRDDTENTFTVEFMNKVEKMEDQEELEELEEAGELEELVEDGSNNSVAAGSRLSANAIKEIESRIEFADVNPGVEETGESIKADLEIVSPFSSMLSPAEPGPGPEPILQEAGGLPRVNKELLSPRRKTEAGLDQDFKKLVGSVMKQKR
jgi:hypothetical protein